MTTTAGTMYTLQSWTQNTISIWRNKVKFRKAVHSSVTVDPKRNYTLLQRDQHSTDGDSKRDPQHLVGHTGPDATTCRRRRRATSRTDGSSTRARPTITRSSRGGCLSKESRRPGLNPLSAGALSHILAE
jgi:hypothetical protein